MLTTAQGEHSDLDRVGVIDVGSNSIRLVVFDGAARSPAYFYNEKVLCGLGRGLGESGMLNPEGRDRALKALRRFARLAEAMKLKSLTTVATAAVREADDGPAFVSEVAEASGIEIQTIDGDREALLSAQGVLLGWPEAQGLVADMGGSSLEMAEIGEGEVGARETSKLGPLHLRDLDAAEADARIAAGLERLEARVSGKGQRMFLVGGSFRAIAKLDMERRSYPLKVLHEYPFDPKALDETLDWLADKTPEDLAGITDTSSERLALVPTAARVLKAVIAAYEPCELAISSYGLREGLLFDRMPDDLRARDPLLEAARASEAASAREPGFGDALFAWLAPLYGDAPLWRARLVHAACLLHDTTWRAHPDYRAEVCFDNATRANLGGLDHRGRVFLALALLHRYKGSRDEDDFDDSVSLLGEGAQRDAEVLGRAMRLGATLSGSDASVLECAELEVGDEALTLRLRGKAQDCAGEVVEKRLRGLAGVMDLQFDLQVA